MGFILIHYTGLDCFRPINEPVLSKAFSQKVDPMCSKKKKEGGSYTPASSAVTPSRTPPEGHGPGPLIEDFVFLAQFFSFGLVFRVSSPSFSCLVFQFFFEIVQISNKFENV
jgi:hypothetical protein